MRLYLDLEANSLIDHTVVDYTASPWKLKPNFKIHCTCLTDLDTGIEYDFVQEDVYTKLKPFIVENATAIIAHNGIGYDLLVLSVALDMPYEIEPDTICGKPVEIVDTLVMSKTLNPDRPGHSIEYFGKLLGEEKLDWRQKAIDIGLIEANAPSGAEFATYHPEMLVYCRQDCRTGIKAYYYLLEEWGDWDWSDAYKLEKAVAEIITRQQHRGFWFDTEFAIKCVKDLDEKMEALRAVVEPLIPEKPLGKTAVKDYIPVEKQFKKDGSPNAHITRFVEKHGGKLERDEELEQWKCTLYGKEYVLPIPCSPIVTHAPAKISDTTHIKGWLVEMGWNPSSWKERDLTVDSRKKKLLPQAFAETVTRYVEQTLNSPFKKHRLEYLGTSESRLLQTLLKHDMKRPLKVYTNPTLTVGQEKEIDPELLAMADKFAHAKDISDYLTYNHRRNSILGGGVDPDDDDEEAEKGWLSVERLEQDHRIPTPADTCGAGTARFKHRLVANIPRVSSPYGKEMRSLFGVDAATHYQLGYDFDGLEARIEAHYTWRYDESKEYCKSLTQEKPNDIHCYDETTEILTTEGWKTFGEITENSLVAQWDDGKISFVKPLGIVWQRYEGLMVSMESQAASMLVTPNHRQIFKHESKGAKWKVATAKDIMEMRRVKLPLNGICEDSSVDLSESEISLLLAVQSDGNYAKDCSAITLSFVKERKVARLKSIIEELNIPHTYRTYLRKDRYEHTFRLNAGRWTEWVRKMLGEHKQLPWSFLKLPITKREFVITEMGIWDGTLKDNGDMVLDQREGSSTVDVIQALAATSGKCAVKNTYYRPTTYSTGYIDRCYVSMKSKKNVTVVYPAHRKVVEYSGMVGCVAVPSTFVVVRRNGRVVVSGNTLTAKKISEIIGETFGRTPAKSTKYACAYGAQPKRVAKTVGCSLELGEKIYHAFWEAAKPLALLNEKLTTYWEQTGRKKFILGIDGRQIPTRSKSALINSLFQSAGVICAKRAMVIHDRKLRAAGLIVDFWRDDWKNSKHVQQLIAYHK